MVQESESESESESELKLKLKSQSEYVKLANKPTNVRIPPTSDLENFNLKLWNIIMEMSGNPIDINDMQPLIGEYGLIYTYLPVDEFKRLNFNPLGCVLGYRLSEFKSITLGKKKPKKGKKSARAAHAQRRYIKKQLNFLKNVQINTSNGLNEYSLIRYIEYFKNKNA